GVNVSVHDKGTRELILKLLGGSSPEWNDVGRAEALELLASASPRSSEKLMFLANIVFRWRLLDVFAQSFSLPTGEDPLVIPRAPRPPTTARRLLQVST